MALFGMPLTVINLGGEMMYILEQRLIAQKIPPEKACKVRRARPLRSGSGRVAIARPTSSCAPNPTALAHAPCDDAWQRAQVIADIVRTMFNAKFVDEL